MPATPTKTRHRGALPATLAIAVAAMLLSSGRAGLANDIDLLRFNTAKPYVLIQLDTSGSMNLAPDGSWVPLGGDDPGSKLYQAKQVLYEVFSSVDDIHLGLATTNQNDFAVTAKHWEYSSREDFGGPLDLPKKGSKWAFGRRIAGPTFVGWLGGCDNHIDLDTPEGVTAFDRFPKLGLNGTTNTLLFLEKGGVKYLMFVEALTNQLGNNTLKANLRLFQRISPDSCSYSSVQSKEITFDRPRGFFMVEAANGFTAPNGSGEQLAGFFNHSDVENNAVCNNSNKRGDGWENNYDGTFFAAPTFTPLANNDPFAVCANRNLPYSDACPNIKRPTVTSSFGRPLDRGDFLPLDWGVDNKDEFLRRLAPNHGSGAPDFGIASYFQNDPDPLFGNRLRLRSTDRVPLIGMGETPLGRMVGEFRCWYQGDDNNKCDIQTYNPGWEGIAKANDPEWGCRKPYQIVISDGLDTCGGPNPCSDTANLRSKAGVRTWVIAYGADCSSVTNPLSCMASNGDGELVCPQNPQNLRDELQRILGIIREEARAFASAAAPTVQAAVADKVYLSNFTPLNGKSVWDGHINSFLKPVPLDDSGRPDTTHPNFNWDAGVVMRDNQAPTQAQADAGNLKLGDAAGERRLFYSRLHDNNGDTTLAGEWPLRRRLLDQTSDSTTDEVRYDLWRGLRIPFTDDVDDGLGNITVDQTAQDRANQVLADTVAIKSHTLDDGTIITYVLGDMFHSTPVVVGGPPNTLYFAQDLEGDGTDCSTGNPGYRCYREKHEFRRQMLMVGSNDGQLHVFDAGLPSADAVTGEVTFDDGTGKEIFAWAPRATLPTLRTLAEGTNHRWGVDGSPVAADVFIDPDYSGTPTAAEREWRTVVVTGLREGGRGYFALDITQPDTLDSDRLPQPDQGYVPSCLGGIDGEGLTTAPASSCGPLPFPAALWEFDDSVLDTTLDPDEYFALDEDGIGGADLGDTWSDPSIGMIELCEGSICDPDADPNDIVRKHVAIFGGGMDTSDKLSPTRGNWIYIVDVETGQAIYKRQVDGAVPSSIGAADTDLDGLIDRLYFGTITGFMYRIDLGLDDGEVPTLVDTTVTDVNGVAHTVKRVPALDASGDPLWEPRIIFSANFDGATPTAQPRPIYQQPAVINVAKLGLYALAFGTGDREDLWLGTTQTGRFYVFVDDTDLVDPAILPYTEANFAEVLPGAAEANTDFLLDRSNGARGWYIPLDPAERLITEAFALSGVTFFSTFQPDVVVSPGKDPLCSKTGVSRVFIVNTTNANSFLSDVDGNKVRYMSVANFVTNPYAELSQTKNPVSGGGDEPPPLPPELEAVKEALKSLFPENCSFASYRIDIRTVAADTGVIHIAPVPVCLIEKNWKEF